MPRRRSTLYPSKARFGGVPGGRRGRRALAKAYHRAVRAAPSIGRSPAQIRRVLRAAGVRYPISKIRARKIQKFN